MRPCLALLLTLTLAVATPAHADWPAGGKPMIKVAQSWNQSGELLFLDLPSGELIAVAVGEGSNQNGHTVQRFTSAGDFAPGWDFNPRVLGSSSVTTIVRQGFVVDDSSCFWRVGPSGTQGPYLGLLYTPDGTVRPGFPGWSMQRTTLPPSSIGWSSAAAGLSGDIYSTYVNRLLRVDRSGALVAGWPATGVVTPGDFGGRLLPDDAGGVVFFSTANAIAQRFDPTGVRHAGWPAGGLALGTPGTAALLPMPWQPLLASGPDGFLASWCTFDPNLGSDGSARLQRFRSDGTIDPAWPSTGLLVVPAGPNTMPSMVADGSGGAYVLWYASGSPRATHVLIDGTVQGAAATALLPAGARFRVPMYTHNSDVVLPYLMGDARSDGGLTYAWNDTAASGTPVIRYRRFTPALLPDPAEPADGQVITPADPGAARFATTLRGVHSDGAGGAYIAWEVMDHTVADPFQWFAETWMTRVTPVGTVGVPPRAEPTALALSAPRPNPARGSVVLDVTLPDGAPARVELLDVMGRIVRRQTAQGVGAHAITFSELGSLEPGPYFARVVSRTAARSARLVVTR